MTMNEITQTATGAATTAEVPGGEQSDEGPSPDPSPGQSGPTLFQRLTGLFRHRNGSSLREDLTDALAEAAHAADFSPAERAMLKNILRLREVRVEDVMVPRGDVQAVEITTTLGELLSLFEKSGHSRMPVYSETLDDPRGMVHIRDLLGHITRLSRARKTRGSRRSAQAKNGDAKPVDGEKFDLGRVELDRTIGELGLMRPILFVPPSMLASDLMARMQAARIQMALVIDEYGGTDGLVSLEDIVEMVVGDIEDEHDEDEPMVTKTGEGIFIVDGKAEIEEVAEMIGEAFKAGEHEEDVDTIGGMIFNTLGRVPARGEVVQAIPGFEFHVLDADPRRVKRVRIVQSRAADRRRRLPKPVVGLDS
jgi:CBS domain containing-hemolysin-like protein